MASNAIHSADATHGDGFWWLPAGAYPPQLLAACARLRLRPEDLLNWSVGKDQLILVLASGQKLIFALEAAWQQAAEDPQPAGNPQPTAGEKKRRAGKQ